MDQILKKLGSPGVYHILIAGLLAVTWWSVALGNTAMTFYGYTPEFECNVPLSDTNGNSNRSHDIVMEEEEQRLSNVTVAEDQCSYTVQHVDSEVTRLCPSWTYKQEGDNLRTIATEWNLVCENKYKISMSNTIFFAGVFFGALIFGFISDCVGRKKTLAICLYLQMPISLAIAFIPNYLGFVILRFLLGVWLQGISTVSFVHCIEFFRQKYRGIVMVGFGMSWAFGQMLTSFLAYIFSDWRQMQMAAAFVAFTTVPYFWWIPESPRWLLVKERYDEIVNIFVVRAAKVNRLDVPAVKESARQHFDEASQEKSLSSSSKPAETFIDMMKIRQLLKRQLIMCYIWCISSLAYYVFLFNISNLAGNRYVNFAISASLEIAMNLAVIFIMAKFGRKRPLIVFCLLVAVLCLVSGTLPKQVSGRDIQWLVTMLSLLGKTAMAAILCLIFVYAAELFPTFARGSCLALCGCAMRLGGMMAPQIIFLKNYTFNEFPYIVIASAVFLSAVLTILLPETNGKQMPNTIDEALHLMPLQKEDQKKENELLASASDDREIGTVN